MTREAKIGLLTGLGVIVLIGVLLSEYLGGPAACANRMASLPVGTEYRNQVRQPVGVPGLAHTQVAPSMDNSPSSSVLGSLANLPTGFATEQQPTTSDPAPLIEGHPYVAPPAIAIHEGQMIAMTPNAFNDMSPHIEVVDPGATAVSLPGDVATKPPLTTETYVIAPGDTLGKIAVKFYKSSKPEDAQRIVAANPALLKNTATMLVVGKKLTIPNVPKTLAFAPVKPATTPGVVKLGNPDPLKTITKTDALKKDLTTYIVQSGDTLEKIAKKLSPGNAGQIATLNKITDPHTLQVGMKLKVPTKN